MRVAFYVRVSTDEQSIDNQLNLIKQYQQLKGWTSVTIFKDAGISGAKGRNNRPGYNEMLTRAESGDFDLLAAWSLDRFARSTSELIQLAESGKQYGFALWTIKESIDTSSASGELFFQIMACIAQFERARLSERTVAGMERARSEGKQIGRPTLPKEKENAILKALRRGNSYASIRSQFQVGSSVITRLARRSREKKA